jgi:hypothetical protein
VIPLICVTPQDQHQASNSSVAQLLHPEQLENPVGGEVHQKAAYGPAANAEQAREMLIPCAGFSEDNALTQVVDGVQGVEQ